MASGQSVVVGGGSSHFTEEILPPPLYGKPPVGAVWDYCNPLFETWLVYTQIPNVSISGGLNQGDGPFAKEKSPDLGPLGLTRDPQCLK